MGTINPEIVGFKPISDTVAALQVRSNTGAVRNIFNSNGEVYKPDGTILTGEADAADITALEADLTGRAINVKTHALYDVNNVAAAINAISDAYSGTGVVIFVPAGTYKFTAAIELHPSVRLMGIGNDGGENVSTTLKKNGNFTGIQLDDNAGITGINLTAENAPNNGGLGILIFGRKCVLKDVTVTKQGSHGIQIGDQVTYSNVNFWVMDNVHSDYNGGDGFFIGQEDSMDTNGGIASGCSASNNTGNGYYFNKTAAGLLLVCYAQTNGTNGFCISSATQQYVFHGCVAEEHVGGVPILFEAGSSNNLWISPCQFTLTDNGTNCIVRNAGGSQQMMTVSSMLQAAELRVSSLYPKLTMYDTDGSADRKYWDIFIHGSTMKFRECDDNGGTEKTFMEVYKAGSDNTQVRILGNFASGKTAAATESIGKAVCAKLPIYNAANGLVGYIPIYTEIT